MKFHLLLLALSTLAIAAGEAQADLIATSDSLASWSDPAFQKSGLPARGVDSSATKAQLLMEEIIVEFQSDTVNQSILLAMGKSPEIVLTDRLCRWRLSKNQMLAPEAINGSVALMDGFDPPLAPWDSFRFSTRLSKKSIDRLLPPQTSRRETFLLR